VPALPRWGSVLRFHRTRTSSKSYAPDEKGLPVGALSPGYCLNLIRSEDIALIDACRTMALGGLQGNSVSAVGTLQA
jgi:hypothetical protein